MFESGQQVVRRTVLLLATTALALSLAGGIALAATFTCSANPCDGTTGDDVLTGTVGAETINGKAGNDQINGLDASDTLNGEDGADRLNGGAGNDALAGGPGNDGYLVTTNWGSDTIIDDGGNNDSIAPAPDGAMPSLTVNLVSGTGPEYADGNGNTLNWNDGAIGSISTGAGDDVISQRPKDSNGMNGGAGDDTYRGYTSDSFGGDMINDPSGATDVLDLSSRDLASARWTTPFASPTTNARYLRIDFHGGPFLCEEEFCDFLDISQYFDSTNPDGCLSGPGPGLIETIKFFDGASGEVTSVDFAQAKSLLGCPRVTNVVPTKGEQNVAPSTNVVATFSQEDIYEGMDSNTLNTSTFTLTEQNSSTPVTAWVSPGSWPDTNEVTLNPSSDLASNTTYTATIKGGSAGAKDLEGHALEHDYSWSFTTGTDTTPPETAIGSGPTGYVRSTSASFSFSSSEEGSTFQCSRDGSIDGSTPACTSPKTYPGPLTQGSHTFRVRAIDKAGNVDTTPATRSWFVDTVVPKGTIYINGGAASTSSRTVTLRLSASDPSPASTVASMRFRNGGTTTWSSWFGYATSKSWTLSSGAGTKTVYVQYRDRAGNLSAAASDTIRFSP